MKVTAAVKNKVNTDRINLNKKGENKKGQQKKKKKKERAQKFFKKKIKTNINTRASLVAQMVRNLQTLPCHLKYTFK